MLGVGLALLDHGDELGKVELGILIALAFGGRAAPVCAGRMVTLLRFLAARLFGLAILDCTDDCNGLEAQESAASALVCWKRLQAIIGFQLEDTKETIGQRVVIQGVLCDVTDSEMKVNVSPSRAEVLRNEIKSIRAEKCFPPKAARKLASKCLFHAAVCLAATAAP